MAKAPDVTIRVTLDTEDLREALQRAWAMGVRRGFYGAPLFTLEQNLEDCPFDDFDLNVES